MYNICLAGLGQEIEDSRKVICQCCHSYCYRTCQRKGFTEVRATATMSVKETFLTASLMTKLALIIISVSNFLNWIAFTTTSWYVVSSISTSIYGTVAVDTTRRGIWRQCTYSECTLLDGVISGILSFFFSIRLWVLCVCVWRACMCILLRSERKPFVLSCSEKNISLHKKDIGKRKKLK